MNFCLAPLLHPVLIMTEPQVDKIFELKPVPNEQIKPESAYSFRRTLRNSVWRRLVLLIILVGSWDVYARWLDNALLIPTAQEIFNAFVDACISGSLPARLLTSLSVLLLGYSVGLILAALLTCVGIASKLGRDLLVMLTAMFNPLPAIALLPLAMLWFGLGTPSLVFVLAHSVIWAVALNTLTGFESVSPTLRMVGRNYGLRGPAFVLKILIPAAMPSLLSGLKVGWAFAWRTLIAAELVFGVAAGSGGLGWFIYENKNQLEIPTVFAGLATVILIGLAVENMVFHLIEVRTIKRWGMTQD